MAAARKKNGDICICLDSSELNRAIEGQDHTVPVVDDVVLRLDAAAALFSTLDTRESF